MRSILSKIAPTCLVTLAAFAWSWAAHASIQTYTLETPENYGDDLIRVIVDVDNNTAGVLTFNVAISPNASLPNTGDLFGLFLEFLPHPTLTSADFVGADITDVDFNTINAGGGNNLNGDIAGLVPGGTFDAAITFGSSGASGGLITSTSLTLDDLGGTLLLSHLVGVGVRAQTVGLPPDGGGGSSKLYTEDFSVPVILDPVPEAATIAMWLGLAGVFGGVGLRNRRLRRA
jgi:hypothetical protein